MTRTANAAGAGAAELLLDAAERGFAAHGVDGVSLREITRSAGQRNTTALQYHFGTRDGLLRAVLARHLVQVEARHTALLDAWEAGPARDPYDLVAALVLPLVAELDREPGGPEFLQIAAEVVNRSDRWITPDGPVALLLEHRDRWSRLVEPMLPLGAVGRPLHRRFAAMRFAHVELGRRARQPRPRRDDRLFASHLVDLVTGVLTAPVSDRTARLVADRTLEGTA